MAIARNGINGNFSGKVGNVVGAVVKGQQVLKSLPKKRTSPPTEKELLNRLKFAVSQSWLYPLTDFLRIGFKDYQPTYEGFVAAKSYNQKNALQSDGLNGFFINPALALLSFGTQELPLTANAVAIGNQEVAISWSTAQQFPYNDQIMLVAYDVANKKVRYNAAAGKRNAGKVTMKFYEEDEGDTFHLYLAFIADDRSSKSNSMYLGSLIIS